MDKEILESSEAENIINLFETPQEIVEEAEGLLTSPWLTRTVIANAACLGVAGEESLILTIYLVGTSRLLDKPLAAIVQGPSSSGKSHLIEKVGKLFPAETVIHATQMTQQSLYYMPPGELSHRFVIAGERSLASDNGQVEATRALREMLSAGCLSKLTPVKSADGLMETQKIEQKGPIAYVESTTSANVFDEDANRCLMLQTDERPEQTQKIMNSVAENYSGKKKNSDRERVVAIHNALQRLLKPLKVIIPFASRLTKIVPDDRIEMRRAFPQILSLIQSSCLLHQRQRVQDGHGRLIAEKADYEIARCLLIDPMTRSFGRGFSEGAWRFYDRIQKWFGYGEFTALDASRKDKFSRRAVNGWLKELEAAGLVNQTEIGRGRSPAKWQVGVENGEETQSDNAILPSVTELFEENQQGIAA